MKKKLVWVLTVVSLIAIVALSLIGLKLLDGRYDIISETVLVCVCHVFIVSAAIYKIFKR